MTCLDLFFKQHPTISSAYEETILRRIAEIKEELKACIPEYRWWEAEEVDMAAIDLNEAEKERVQWLTVSEKVCDLMLTQGLHSVEFQSLLEDIDKLVASCESRERKAVEIMIIEDLAAAARNTSMHESLYSVMPSGLQRLWDTNDRFWSSVDGGLAAALRQERSAPSSAYAEWFAKKALNYADDLGRWLKCNPCASPGDRAAAENVLLDLLDAVRDVAK